MKNFNKFILSLFLLSSVSVAKAQNPNLEYATSQTNSTSGCICSVLNPGRAVDNDPDTYSELQINGATAGNSIQQTLRWPTPACVGDTIFIRIQDTKGISDQLLKTIWVNTFLGTTNNSDEKQLPGLTSTFIENGITLVKFVPTKRYDGVRMRIDVESANFVNSLQIYDAARFTDTYEITAGNTTLCQGDSTVLSVKTTRSTTTYTWYDSLTGGSPLFTGNSDFHTGPLNTSKTYYLQRCEGSTRVPLKVTVKIRPSAPVVTGDTIICKGQSTVLTASSPFVGAIYHWFDFTGTKDWGFTDNLTTPPLQETTVFQVYTILDGCRSDSSTYVTIIIVEPLTAPIINCGVPTINSVTFEWAPVAGAISYTISLDGGKTFQDIGNINSRTVTGLSFGDKVTIIVKAVGGAPCFDGPNSIAVTCVATNCTPVTFDVPNGIKECRGDVADISLSNISAANYEISWNGGAFSNNNNYQYEVNSTTTIPVVVRNIDQPGCPAKSDSVFVTVLERPVADFSSGKQLITVPGGVVQFFENTPGSASYKWDFGDGKTSTDKNPIHVYNEVGKFTVMLIVTNSDGCIDTLTRLEYIEGKLAPKILIPNTFTPNGDNLNDKFEVKGDRIQEYHMRVFNTQGKLMYESRSLVSQWDGTFEGIEQPVGAYFFVMNATADDLTPFDQKGLINLIR